MALALDPFDIDFAPLPRAPHSIAVERGSPMPLPTIALCLPTLFGPATFAISPFRSSAPPSGEAAEK